MKNPILMTLFVILIMTICISLVDAQPHPGNILVGHAVDSDLQTPIEYATAILFDSDDSTQVTGAVTDKRGQFQLMRIRPGSYFIRISFIGYSVRTIHGIEVKRGQPRVDLGDIALVRTSVSLDEVTVLGERPALEYQIDKKVINVARQYTTIAGTAVDVLENAPSVTVDIEGNVKLRGSSNFTVLIDGRPSILEPNDALTQIPASTIESIEIITNPSAKYDPDGTSGIINIVMKKSRPQGISGILNVSGGFDDRHGGDILLNRRTNSFNLLLGGDHNRRFSPGTSKTENRTFQNNSTSYIFSSGDRRRGRTFYGMRGGIGLNLSSKDVLNLGFRYGDRAMERSSQLEHDEWSEPGVDHSLYTSQNITERAGDFYSVNMDYQRQFARKGHEITAQAIFSDRNGDEETMNELIDQDGTVSSGQRATEEGPARRTRLKLDYIRPFRGDKKLEAGYQSRLGQSENINELYEYDSLLARYEFRPQFSHTSDYTRNIHAVYTMYSGKLGVFGYQGGIRGEYTYRMIELVDENAKFSIDRWDVFPTVHLSRQWSGERQLMASYTRRIQRPRSWFLEPFETWSDAYTVRQGNPALQPEYIDSYEAGYQTFLGRSLLTLEAYYRITHNRIEFVRSVYAENITLRSVENVGRDYVFGTEYMLNWTPLKAWNINLLGNLYNHRIEGKLHEESFSEESFTWDVRMKNTFKFPKAVRIQINGIYNSPTISSQGRREGFFRANLAVRKDFFDRTLSATLQIRDVFATAEYESISEGTDFYNYRRFTRKAPMAILSLSYNFNNYKSERNRDLERNQEDSEEEEF